MRSLKWIGLTSVFVTLGTSAGAKLAPESVTLKGYIKAHCAECHTGDGAQVRKFGNFLDANILRHAIDKSSLFKKVETGDMPPTYLGEAELSPNEKERFLTAITNWVRAGYPALVGGQKNVAAIRNSEVLGLIADDLSTAGAQGKNLRYLSLLSIYNNPSLRPSLNEYRRALVRLLNSLTWNERLVFPAPIDDNNLVYRIDLEQLGWDQSTWELLQKTYPFATESLAGVVASSKIAEATGSKLAVVRAEWFIANVSKPPLYNTFLSFPGTIQQLEESLGVQAESNIDNGKVVRAGFSDSGVSNNNRVIERHSIPDNSLRPRAYWKSYDFAGNVGDKNIFQNPVLPRTRGTPAYPKVNAGVPDGGETIFSLPNGLQAYVLYSAAGTLLDKAPIAIVSDPSRIDRTVTNGISCMGCHANGYIPKADQVTPYWVFQSIKQSADPYVENYVRKNYDKSTELAQYFETDNKQVRSRLKQIDRALGISKRFIKQADPIGFVEKRYTSDLRLADLNAEVTFGELPGESPVLKQLIERAKISTVKRDDWETLFPTLLSQDTRNALIKSQRPQPSIAY